MDPRVKATTPELTKQFELSERLRTLRAELQPIGKKYQALVAEVAKAKARVGENPIKEQIEALRNKLETFANPAAVRSGAALELDALDKVKRLFDDLQAVDAAPTRSQQTAVNELQQNTIAVMERWKAIAPEVATLNAQLASAGLEPLKFRN